MLQQLNTLADHELRPDFVRQLGVLRSRISKKVKPKHFSGRENTLISGPMLVEMANAYCDALNQGSIPTIESAWDYVWQEEVTKGVKQALESDEVWDYIEWLCKSSKPLTDAQIEHEREQVLATAMRMFESGGCSMLNENDNHK